MKSTIFIPKKCKVGFQNRTDTYTGKLGYIIAFDGKKWRKEPSWEGWRTKFNSYEELLQTREKLYVDYKESMKRSLAQYKVCYANEQNQVNKQWYFKYVDMTDEDFLKEYHAETFAKFIKSNQCYVGNVSDDPKIQPLEFENTPTEGFVLNKKAGGHEGSSSSWNVRATYCRVYDPRGFEFEISIPNLLYILENANSIKGKGLDGKFIYGWDEKDLVLIPEQSPEYKEMVNYTELQTLKVSAKDLKVGNIYLDSKGDEVVYLDKNHEYSYGGEQGAIKLWFYHIKSKQTTTYGIDSIKKDTGNVTSELAELLDVLDKNTYYKPKHKKIAEHVEITNFPQIQKEMTQYHQNCEKFYIKEKNKYKAIYLVSKCDYSWYGSTSKYTLSEIWLCNKRPSYRNGYNRPAENSEVFKSFDKLVASKGILLYKQIYK